MQRSGLATTLEPAKRAHRHTSHLPKVELLGCQGVRVLAGTHPSAWRTDPVPEDFGADAKAGPSALWRSVRSPTSALNRGHRGRRHHGVRTRHRHTGPRRADSGSPPRSGDLVTLHRSLGPTLDQQGDPRTLAPVDGRYRQRHDPLQGRLVAARGLSRDELCPKAVPQPVAAGRHGWGRPLHVRQREPRRWAQVRLFGQGRRSVAYGPAEANVRRLGSGSTPQEEP